MSCVHIDIVHHFECFVCLDLNRDEMAAITEVRSEESTGLKQKDGLIFIEKDAWKLRNPSKKLPSEKLVWHPVLQDDGQVVSKEGLWQKEGATGVHRFERYRDSRVSSSTLLDDGMSTITEGQQERCFDLAAQELKIGAAKIMSLDDLDALAHVSDEEAKKNSDSEDSAGTSDAEAERQEEDVDKPLFRFMGRAASSSGAQTTPKVSKAIL